MIEYKEIIKCETGTKIIRQTATGFMQFTTIVDLVPIPNKDYCIQVLSRDGYNVYYIDFVEIGKYNSLMIIDRVKRGQKHMEMNMERKDNPWQE